MASASRRNFLKKGAVAGAAAVALYVAPNMTSVTARPAYASITGGTAAPRCVETKLTASDAADADQFGISVSISGDTATIGARGNDDAGFFSGSAYIFRRHEGGADNWGEFNKLNASDAASSDQFGFSVSISGDTAIVGARLSSDVGTASGSAYIYQNCA